MILILKNSLWIAGYGLYDSTNSTLLFVSALLLLGCTLKGSWLLEFHGQRVAWALPSPYLFFFRHFIFLDLEAQMTPTAATVKCSAGLAKFALDSHSIWSWTWHNAQAMASALLVCFLLPLPMSTWPALCFYESIAGFPFYIPILSRSGLGISCVSYLWWAWYLSKIIIAAVTWYCLDHLLLDENWVSVVVQKIRQLDKTCLGWGSIVGSFRKLSRVW